MKNKNNKKMDKLVWKKSTRNKRRVDFYMLLLVIFKNFVI